MSAQRLLALAMSAARWADRVGLRVLFPAAARRRLHTLKKWLFQRPLRFTFPRSNDGAVPVRLVVVGEPFAAWVPALTDADTWRGLPSVAEVVLLLDDAILGSMPAPTIRDSRTIVLPLREEAIAACRKGLGLFPDAKAVEILRDKRRFADYVTVNGLTGYCPINYVHPQDIRLPCIVKRARDQDRAQVMRTQEELDALLATESWNPERFAVQEFIPGNVEYTTHAIMKNGRPLWSASFRFEKDGDARVGVEFKTMAPFDPPPAVFEAAERILRPLGYSGPCNIDYTLRASGEIALFEINPRFGGTMFLPENRALLQQALRRLVEAAVQQPAA
jgi:hypothetical protein